MVRRKRGPEHDWSGWLRKRLHLYRSERVRNYLDRRERLCLDRPAGVCGTNVSFHSEISDPRSRTFFKFTQLWAACRERAEIIFYIAVLAIRWQFARGLRIRDFDVGSVGSVLGADFIYDVSCFNVLTRVRPGRFISHADGSKITRLRRCPQGPSAVSPNWKTCECAHPPMIDELDGSWPGYCSDHRVDPAEVGD